MCTDLCLMCVYICVIAMYLYYCVRVYRTKHSGLDSLLGLVPGKK